MTLDLLRYSRREKALMVIVATGATYWPMKVVVPVEEMIQKWEDQLGPLKDLRTDLYGPGGHSSYWSHMLANGSSIPVWDQM